MPTLIYILHSGQLYGTERMALHTLQQLAQRVQPVLLAPPGPLHQAAAELGIRCHCFNSLWSLARLLWPLLRQPGARVCSTGVSQALLAFLLGGLRGRAPHQIHVVHGGTDERLSYGRKHCLQYLGIRLVAVSDYVRERLLAHRCRAQAVTVIENFLPDPVAANPAPPPRGGLRQVALITRLDPIKQVGLAVQAWQNLAPAHRPKLMVCGTGWQQASLRSMAQDNPAIHWLGYVADPGAVLRGSDLYLHTCAQEPFGLAILEAMQAGVPVLAPDSGGAGALVKAGQTGFHYRAGDVADLQAQLQKIAAMPAAQLQAIASAARAELASRFNPARRCADYARLLELEPDHV